MKNLAKQPGSYLDILDFPENMAGEIINGHLETHPRPTPKHALVSPSIDGGLVPPLQRGKEEPGGWWIPNLQT